MIFPKGGHNPCRTLRVLYLGKATLTLIIFNCVIIQGIASSKRTMFEYIESFKDDLFVFSDVTQGSGLNNPNYKGKPNFTTTFGSSQHFSITVTRPLNSSKAGWERSVDGFVEEGIDFVTTRIPILGINNPAEETSGIEPQIKFSAEGNSFDEDEKNRDLFVSEKRVPSAFNSIAADVEGERKRESDHKSHQQESSSKYEEANVDAVRMKPVGKRR